MRALTQIAFDARCDSKATDKIACVKNSCYRQIERYFCGTYIYILQWVLSQQSYFPWPKIIQKMRVVAGLWGCRRGRTNLNDDKKMPGPPQARTILKRMIVSSKTLFQDRSRTGDRLALWPTSQISESKERLWNKIMPVISIKKC